MKYRIYERYVTSSSLLIGTFCEKSNVPDVLEESISICQNLSAKIAYLYQSTLENYPLPKFIVNILTHEDKLSILELKKNNIRITFFIDYNGMHFLDKNIPRLIVFLSCFKKEKKEAPKNEIMKAQKIRDIYLQAKADKTLEIEVVKYE